MNPAVESSYESFPKRKITCDDVLSVVASVVAISCIITYFVYLAIR